MDCVTDVRIVRSIMVDAAMLERVNVHALMEMICTSVSTVMSRLWHGRERITMRDNTAMDVAMIYRVLV